MLTPRFIYSPKVTSSLGWRRAAMGVLAMAVMALAVASAPSANAQDSTVSQCNGVDNQGGRTVHCTVAIDITGGDATVTVTSCTGAGTAETCIGPTVSTQAVTAIDQCNGSGNGGGGTVTCDVIITGAPAGGTDVTISQCVASGTGGGTQPTTVCVPGSTPDDTSADIQQCNSSGNGGGGTERVQCSVTPANTTASLPTIEQCNGSGNGGGALVTCTVTINTGGTTGTPTATASAGSATPPAGDTTTPTAGGTGTPSAGATPSGGSTPSGSGTPPSGVFPPNTGSGPVAGADAGGLSLVVVVLAALGLLATGGAIVIRRQPSRD